MPESPAPQPVCATCAHFDADKSSLAHLGFGHCDYMRAGRDMSGRARCAFSPARWSPRHAQAAAKTE